MNRTGRSLQRAFRRATGPGGRANNAKVTIIWRTAAAPSGNPAIQPLVAPAVQDLTEEVDALVHYVGSNDTGGDTVSRVRFGDIQKGDLLVDFIGDIALEGRTNIRFRVGGIDYVQKNTGGQAAASWDVRCGGEPVFRTLCLTPLT